MEYIQSTLPQKALGILSDMNFYLNKDYKVDSQLQCLATKSLCFAIFWEIFENSSNRSVFFWKYYCNDLVAGTVFSFTNEQDVIMTPFIRRRFYDLVAMG